MPVNTQLQQPKPLGLSYNLTNPYVKPKPSNTGIVPTSYYQKPLGSTKPVAIGNVKVDTKNPVIVESDANKGQGNEITEESKTSFWEKRTKIQKGLIIGGAVAIVAFVGYRAFVKK